MAISLHQVDTVVLGHFNPYIVRPEWLAQYDIAVSESVQVTVDFFERDVVGFNFKIDNCDWRVDYNRLVITSEAVVNTSQLAADVVAQLPHTPIRAVGNNFRFRCARRAWDGPLPQIGSLDFDEVGSVGSLQSGAWKAVVETAPGQKMTVEVSAENLHEGDSAKVMVNFNHHRFVNQPEDLREASERFEDDLAASRDFISSKIGVRVED